MSEDSRSGRKPSRQLYIANPGSDDDDPKQHVANGRPNVAITSRHPLNHTASSPYKLSTSQSNPLPAQDHPTPDSHHQHHLSQSSSSPDNSASPSSPPSTPGFPSFHGSYDKSDTSSTLSYTSTLTPSNDRAYYDPQSSASYKSSRTPKQYIKPPSGGRPLPPRADPSRRPNAGNDHQSSPAVMSASPDRVIIATKDSELYVTVDLSGVKTAPQMRELILSKLKIYTEDENNPYLIYQTEIGAYAIGEPLSDSRLLSLCREQGDSKGTLKFLVTHSFAPVHEPPPPSHPVDYCPMPPPAHAAHVPIKPLRTKPRQSSRSRNGSISSSSEILTPEIANGYDADIDNPEASPPKPSSLPPSPPRRPSLGNQGRSGSPDQPTSPPPVTDRRINGRKEDRLAHALPPIPLAPPPAPPLSPNRPSFPSHGDLSPSLSIPSVRRQHARSGSDAGADRELSSRANDLYAENGYRLLNSQHSSLTHLKSPASRDNIRTQSRRPTYDDDDNGQEIILPNGGRSVVDLERHSPTLQRRPLYGQRPHSPYTSRSHITQNPTRGLPTGLPSVAPSETRPLTKTRGQLPLGLGNAFVSYIAESAHKKQPPASSSSWQNNRLAKNATKSMDNLKFASQAGSSRRNPIPPTPQLPIISSTNNRDVAYSPSSTLSISGMPKSYETSPRFIRPLPQKGLPPGNSFDILPSASSQYSSRGYPPTLISPNYEPFPRPQSAASDAISPTRSISHSQSPVIYGSSLDSGEHNRSPRTVSPNRSYHSPGFMGGGGPRPRPTNSDRSDGPDHSPPPLTPQDSQLDERGIVDPSPPLSPRGIVDKDSNSSSELTLKEDGKKYFAKLLGNATPTGTQVASQTVEQPRSGKRLTPSPPPLERNDSSSSYAFEDDDYDSYIGGGTWIVRPEPGKNAARPPLKVQIETPTRSSTGEQDVRPELPPKDAPPSRPPPVDPNLLRVQSRRPESTFIDPDSDNWAPRPPPENIYEELEKFFPKHDLDKPVIEASSGDTSPTNAEPVAALPPIAIPDDRGRIRAKKSIRIVAQEHKKRIDRTSKAADAIAQKDNMMRKRSTKLWGSKLEEVTTLRNNSTISLPDSPSGGPTTFKWVRGELIGKGTYGRVYLALNATTGEMIAVKQVELPQTASDKNDTRQHTVVQALKMESETLRDLDHPHIVQYLGFEETPANLSIFLEYVPGGSVGSCLHKHGKFADNVTRSFTAQILSGLEYLHSKGILHRDMKADNILVEMSGICKISDFGISKRTEDLQGGAFTAMQGTVFWMAPEVVNAQKKGYNFKVDIWSVGCVVLEMWAGKRPWTGEEMVAVMFKLYQSKQPPPVPDDVILGEDADDFRQKCFAINPEERPSAAELRKHPYLILPPGWAFTGFT